MFDTEEKCYNYLAGIRWGDKIKCPHCGHDRVYITDTAARYGKGKHNKIKYVPAVQYKCANSKCYKKFTITSGTAFQGCKTTLKCFFYLMYSAAMNKKNVSSSQQAINIGLTQKSSWYIMARIRMFCYQDSLLKLSGEVEVDETYLACGKWSRHDKYINGRKVPVLGLIERGGGKIIVRVIPNKSKKTVQKVILSHVETGSRLITDSAACYINMENYYFHNTINHRDGVYVVGDVHTNNIENAWTKFKKGIVATHHGVSILHLQRYCDEFAYRWNNRHLTPKEKFDDLIKRACLMKPITEKKVGFGARKKHLQSGAKKYTQEDFDAIPIGEFSFI